MRREIVTSAYYDVSNWPEGAENYTAFIEEESVLTGSMPFFAPVFALHVTLVIKISPFRVFRLMSNPPFFAGLITHFTGIGLLPPSH